MAKRRKTQHPSRDRPRTPAKRSTGIALTSSEVWKILCADGYRPVMQCPEIQTCIGIYAELIGAMTLHLMQHTTGGDVRVINELSRRLDIEPGRYMTRTVWMQTLVRTLMEVGNQVTLPIYRDGYLDELIPLPPGEVSVVSDGLNAYHLSWRGQIFQPEEVLHFRLNPDPARPWEGRGYQAALRDLVRGLRQANATRQALLESPAPSIIVKVDGLTEEFADAEGRRQLREQYLDASDNGLPWFIPAEAFAVEQVRPLTMNDLAIRESLELDKRSIASIFGVPPFLLGVGEFRQEEYQLFLSTRVMAVAREIEQELTRGLLYSHDFYWRFNPRSLYNYSLSELVSVGKELVDRAAMRRNELRDWLGMTPDPDMEEMYLLENYLPTNMLDKQQKLIQEGGDDDADEDADAADQDL